MSWSSAGFLCRFGWQRHAADHAWSDPGTEDCRHHFNHLEEGSEFRPQTVTSASSLSISAEEGFPSFGDSLWWWAVRFWRCSVREEYQSMRSALCAWHRVTHYTLCPLG